MSSHYAEWSWGAIHFAQHLYAEVRNNLFCIMHRGALQWKEACHLEIRPAIKQNAMFGSGCGMGKCCGTVATPKYLGLNPTISNLHKNIC